MNIYPELKKIAGANAKIGKLAAKLENEIGGDGLILEQAQLVNGCKEKDGHLYRNGRRLDTHGLSKDGDYYCEEYHGCCEDSCYGTLYYKTNVPGQFVAVPFEA